jgi:putative kinase
MSEDFWAALSKAQLYLDQTNKPLEMDRDEIAQYYEPLARLILARRRPGQRQIVAVAGPPGGGKTAFSTILMLVVNTLAGQNLAVQVGMDAWHFPNAYLDSHMTEKNGQTVLLRSLKGSPETYDRAGIHAFIEAAHREASLTYPVYSRELHDPIPDAGLITAEQQVVILEGNYFLLDEPPWSDMQRLFDLRIMIFGQVPDLLDGLRARHLRGRKTAEAVDDHLRRVDIPNMQYVLDHSRSADVTVYKADNRHISRVEWSIGG